MSGGAGDDHAALVRLVDELEGSVAGYLSLERVAARFEDRDALAAAVADGVLLIDARVRLDPRGKRSAVTLCRLNRHHPLVRHLLRAEHP